MTAKQYLMGYRHLESNYKCAIEEYKNVENEMISLKSPNLEERVQTSPKKDPIGEIVIDMEKEKAKLGINIQYYKSQMLVIRSQIKDMKLINEDYCAILLFRYVLYKDWKYICNSLAMSRTQANKVHGMALLEFDRKFSHCYEK